MNRRVFYRLIITLLAVGGFFYAAPPLVAQPGTAPAIRAPQWRVRLAALTPRGRIQSIDSAQVSLWTSGGHVRLLAAGNTVNLATPELLSLRRSDIVVPARNAGPPPWWLHLRTGAVLAGNPVGTSGGIIAFDSLVFGKISVPVDDVAGLTRRRNTPMLHGIAHDHLQFINGDQLSGAMLQVLPQAVQWKSTLGTISIPLVRIATINLAKTLAPSIYRGPRVGITFSDGTMVTASAVAWRGTTLVLTVPSLAAIRCGVGMIQRIDILGGNLTWLTDLAPQKYVQTPYVGTPWPLVKNANCVLRRLKVNGRVFRHGLGTHVAARLIYNLADKYSKLTFIPAMDQSSRPWGACKVVVQADGKTVYTSGILRSGELLPPVLLSVKQVKVLEFIITGIHAYGVRGRVDILNAALLR
ncbi:MAG: NPCBM/NEW2 domain-containing protein [Phycisphaerae bacterium]